VRIARPMMMRGQRIGWVLRDRPAKTTDSDGARAPRPGGPRCRTWAPRLEGAVRRALRSIWCWQNLPA